MSCLQPDAPQVKAARERVQELLGLGITAAQDWCADQVCSTRRAWQQWEKGDRRMHAGFWRLFSVRLEALEVET